MRLKINSTGAKLLKTLHIIFITFWIGGLLTWLPLIFTMPLQDRDATYITYLNLRSIAWNVIGWGGIGSFVTGLLNGLLTTWGLFKHKWVTLKLISTIGMILLGMFYTEQRMLSNLAMLKDASKDALTNIDFLGNHDALKMVVPIQLIIFFLIVMLSVFKPWMSSRSK